MSSDLLFSVEDQVVLVSGGSRGIGFAIAQGFAERHARVVITGRDQASCEDAAATMKYGRHPVRGIACDVQDRSMIDTAVGTVVADYESIDTLINVASLNTDRPLKNVAPYAMSKAGIGTMTRALALEWGPHGVRVNGLAPGFILTDLTKKLWSDETMQAWGKANTPQRRLGVPEDMVGSALFLASRASAFMTGQTLYVDGGFTAGWAWPIPE